MKLEPKQMQPETLDWIADEAAKGNGFHSMFVAALLAHILYLERENEALRSHASNQAVIIEKQRIALAEYPHSGSASWIEQVAATGKLRERIAELEACLRDATKEVSIPYAQWPTWAFAAEELLAGQAGKADNELTCEDVGCPTCCHAPADPKPAPCPDCSGLGYYATGDTNNPTQTQCERCHTVDPKPEASDK
jgi:hypothetical protein